MERWAGCEAYLSERHQTYLTYVLSLLQGAETAAS